MAKAAMFHQVETAEKYPGAAIPPRRQQPAARKVGTPVSYREGFTNIVRRGVVVSVNVIENGYPVTMVNFPGWKGIIEFAVEALADFDQFDPIVNWWAS